MVVTYGTYQWPDPKCQLINHIKSPILECNKNTRVSFQKTHIS